MSVGVSVALKVSGLVGQWESGSVQHWVEMSEWLWVALMVGWSGHNWDVTLVVWTA